jgi:hypothetical protein
MSNIARYGFHAPTTFSGVDADGHDVLDEQGFAVGHPSCGPKVALASRPPIIGRADRVGEDLAVVAEAVGQRGRAHLGAGRRAVPGDGGHADTAAWYSASVTST